MDATKFNVAALTTRMFSPYLTCSTRIAAFTTAVFPQTALITSKITVNDSFSASKVGTFLNLLGLLPPIGGEITCGAE